jgi:hypothetical protein
MDSRIEIVMLKLIYTENCMMFGHAGCELWRFEHFVFYAFDWNVSTVYTKLSKRHNLSPGCPNVMKFSVQINLSMEISILESIFWEI